MNKTQFPLSPPAPLELPFRALQQIAPTLAGMMDKCHVAQVALDDGRVISLTEVRRVPISVGQDRNLGAGVASGRADHLTAPQPAKKKDK